MSARSENVPLCYPKRPCLRCGVFVSVKRREGAELVGVCRDCRLTDPQWVHAVKSGQRCA